MVFPPLDDRGLLPVLFRASTLTLRWYFLNLGFGLAAFDARERNGSMETDRFLR
jgi:hypothetical protein